MEPGTLETLLREAISATSVHAPSFFSWYGRRETPHSLQEQRTLTRRQLLSALCRSLAERLYVDFYCTGGAVRRPPGEIGNDIEDADWLDRLARANRSTECWDAGWTEVRRDGRSLIIRKDGVTLRVAGGTTCRSHKGLSILVPNEYLKLSPGFYMAASHEAFPSQAPVFRVYWNLTAEGAAAFVRHGTKLLNADRIPFRLKVAAHPAAFDRCDAAVLYVLRRDRDRIFGSLGKINRILRDHLKPGTPVFTKPIAAGMAIAEDPTTAESFGESRCAILAQALVRYDESERNVDERLEKVRSAFARRGVPLHRTFLNPGSRDVYPTFL